MILVIFLVVRKIKYKKKPKLKMKKGLTEQDISTKFIIPAIEKSGWNIFNQVLEQKSIYQKNKSITKGRFDIQGSIQGGKIEREKKTIIRPDFILYTQKNFPIAVIEVKGNKYSVGHGIQQAIKYAEMLDAPFAYSTNGYEFLEHDFLTGKEKELSLNEFPTEKELYFRYKQAKIKPNTEEAILYPYDNRDEKQPRYCQQVAINRVVKAVAEGQKRILLVMATGVGKTLTAKQIIWRLWKSRTKQRILFLADRNVLVDQTISNDFRNFGNAMTKIKRDKIDTAYEIYLGLYQSLSGSEEKQNVYKQFSKDFFDLVIIDECHRGSAEEGSNWRQILEYFSSATQIGMTATPKETDKISNQDYFGEAIYTYSLKQGIEDGFLAPYKVIRIMLDKDICGYRPAMEDRDRHGNEMEGKNYQLKDFDRKIVLGKRTEIVAKEITKFLKETDRFSKTIVFCVDIEHAGRMRDALIQENNDLVQKNSKYIMRITGDDDEGKNELDNFISVNEKYPTIVTTSKLLTTGIDTKGCKLIVIDSNINSMTEFKQIIGRGTRIKEEIGKTHFTILDFRRVTDKFADPDFDGESIKIKEIKQGEEFFSEEEKQQNEILQKENLNDKQPAITIDNSHSLKGLNFVDKKEKIYVDNVSVDVIFRQKEIIGKDGRITVSLNKYTKKQILDIYQSLDHFVARWQKEKKKTVILEELKKNDIYIEELKEDLGEVGKDLDPFDLILHIAFGKEKIKTRKERANKVRKTDYLKKYGEQARNILDHLLDKYAEQGIENLEDMKILQVNPFNSIGKPMEIINHFGGKKNYQQTIRELEKQIYSEVA